MTLKKWVVLQGGVASLAKKLGTNRETIYVWLRGNGSPTLGMSYVLVTMSKGQVTFQQILKESTRNKKVRS